jgi:hypothetical protein
MKFKEGDKVTSDLDSRFTGRVGTVVGYTDNEYWINKGQPVIVSFVNEDAGTFVGFFVIPPFSEFAFAENELELVL